MGDEDGWRLGHRPQLDVVRALAVTLVVACHARFLPPLAGNVGVTMFFALSGFLITCLLIEEHHTRGRIWLMGFYARRACRLFPALALFLATMAVIALMSDATVMPSARDFLGAIAYVGNYTSAMQDRDTTISHTWSLAIEEQFYILWPCVLLVVLTLGRGRLRLAAAAAGVGSLVAVVLRVVLWDDGRGALRVHFGTDTRMDALLIGCLAAMWMHRRPVGRSRPGMAMVLVVAAGALSLVQDVRLAIVVLPTVVALATSAAILALVQGAATGVFASRSLQLVGRRSYGIYLWHYPLVTGAAALAAPVRWPALLGAVLLTAAVVHLSWRCVEEPFLGLKHRFHGSDRVRLHVGVR